MPAARPPTHPGGPGAPEPSGNPDRNGQCTAPQLRRFIKSRPYVPMHELRRRFGIDGDDDDVTPVKLDPGWVYVGLPNREGSLLGDLLRAGEIGYELSLDPRTPIHADRHRRLPDAADPALLGPSDRDTLASQQVALHRQPLLAAPPAVAAVPADRAVRRDDPVARDRAG